MMKAKSQRHSLVTIFKYSRVSEWDETHTDITLQS